MQSKLGVECICGTCICVREQEIRCGREAQGQIALISPFAVSATFPKWLLFASAAARAHPHAPGEYFRTALGPHAESYEKESDQRWMQGGRKEMAGLFTQPHDRP